MIMPEILQACIGEAGQAIPPALVCRYGVVMVVSLVDAAPLHFLSEQMLVSK